jgi:hypothetical protein
MHNKELRNSYSSLNIIREIKSSMYRRDEKSTQHFIKGRDHFSDQGTDGRIK